MKGTLLRNVHLILKRQENSSNEFITFYSQSQNTEAQ